MVGEPNTDQGWILHLSSSKNQLDSLLNLTIPYLSSGKIVFKIPKNADIAKDILNGEFGVGQIGKIITIYPNDDQHALRIAKDLIQMTEEFLGPKVPTDIRIGNIIYARYGSYKATVHPSSGVLGRFIKFNSEILEDSPNTATYISKHLQWPFAEIAPLKTMSQNKLLNNRYKILTTIKSDAKGNVFQGLYFKNFMNIKKCIIKEGKENMWIDDFGRSIRDRLIWQHDLYKRLDTKVPIPKIFDIFHEDDNTHLAMEYIDGVSLNTYFSADEDSYHPWPLKSTKTRRNIIAILIKIVDIIAKLHSLGVIHRDITPGNFLITKNLNVFLIDLELAYSISENSPNPPFRLGTPGFMSPEQAATDIPTFAQDIFSIGALISVMTTSLTATKFDGVTTEKQYEAIYYLTQDSCLAELVSSSLSKSPDQRPSINLIQNKLGSLSIAENSYSRPLQHFSDTNTIRSLVNKAIQGMSTDGLVSSDGIWRSALISGSYDVQKYLIGYHSGLAGTLHLIAIAKSYGFNIDSCLELYRHCIDIVIDIATNKKTEYASSLMGGAAGLALSIKSGFESGLLAPNETNIAALTNCITDDCTAINLANGVAGIGYVVNECRHYIPTTVSTGLYQDFLDKVLNSQDPNGSWENALSLETDPGEMTGLINGTAGIVLFLISHVKYNPTDHRTIEGLKKALSWLEDTTLPGVRRGKLKRKKNGANGLDWTLYNGKTGIALCFIRAFDLFKEIRYKEISEQILYQLPEFHIEEDFSLAFGMTGIGEVLLEAYTTLGNKEWYDRTHWIATVLFYTVQDNLPNKGLWSIGLGNEVASAGLMTGNSGVIHFLMRYMYPDKMKYII